MKYQDMGKKQIESQYCNCCCRGGSIASLLLIYFFYTNTNIGQKTIVGSQSSNGTFPTKISRAVKVNPWNSNETSSNIGSIINSPYVGINETEGTIVLNNQRYFMTMLDGNLKSIIFNDSNGTAIEFASVTFTFARPPNLPMPSNPIIPVMIQFQDGMNETLHVQVQKDLPETVLSSHGNPRAAITITQRGHLMANLADK